MLSVLQNYRRSIEDGQQKYSHEICQALGREGAHRNGAYHRGAPRRITSKRKPDVQDPADKAGNRSLSQAPALQLRQKKVAANDC